jgi:hypothetical protein
VERIVGLRNLFFACMYLVLRLRLSRHHSWLLLATGQRNFERSDLTAISFVIFQVLTAQGVKTTAFSDIAPCIFLEVD